MITSLYFAVLAYAVSAISLDAAEQLFVTNLVDDIKSHKEDYIAYYITGSIPPNILSLANEARTYSGSDFASLLEENNLDVTSLEAFAAHLPWATRLDIASETINSATISTTASSGDSSSSTKTTASSSSRSTGSVKLTSCLVVMAGIAAALL